MIVFGPSQCQVSGCEHIASTIQTIHSEGMSFVQVRICQPHYDEYAAAFWKRILTKVEIVDMQQASLKEEK